MTTPKAWLPRSLTQAVKQAVGASPPPAQPTQSAAQSRAITATSGNLSAGTVALSSGMGLTVTNANSGYLLSPSVTLNAGGVVCGGATAVTFSSGGIFASMQAPSMQAPPMMLPPMHSMLQASDLLDEFAREMVKGGIRKEVAKNLPMDIYATWIADRAEATESGGAFVGSAAALDAAKQFQTKTEGPSDK